ncbi:MAG: response regulator [Nitrospirales bacterium]|nr:response regulator [Nitrospirales bacterium]
MTSALGNILLADDEETFLEATSDLFQEEGFDCHTVRNAEELGRVLHGTWDIDVLITDLNMPGNRVMELVGEVRSQTQHLPVIIVTGYPSLPTAVESVRLHVLEYFIKPVEFSTLLSTVKRGIRHKEVLRTVQRAQKEVASRAERLAALEEALQSYGTSVSDPMVEKSLLTDPEIHELQIQVESLSQALEQGKEGRGLPSSLSASDYFRLRESVYDTIQILQKTKSAFRSKDLAFLRKRLENVLRETAEPLKSTPPSTDATEGK